MIVKTEDDETVSRKFGIQETKRGKKEPDHVEMSKVILLEKKVQVDKSNIVKNMDYGRLMSFSTFSMVKITTLTKIYIPLKIPKYDQLTPPASTLRRRETLGRKNWRHFRELGRQPTNRKGRMFGRASAFTAFRGEYFSEVNIFQGGMFFRGEGLAGHLPLQLNLSCQFCLTL